MLRQRAHSSCGFCYIYIRRYILQLAFNNARARVMKCRILIIYNKETKTPEQVLARPIVKAERFVAGKLFQPRGLRPCFACVRILSPPLAFPRASADSERNVTCGNATVAGTQRGSCDGAARNPSHLPLRNCASSVPWTTAASLLDFGESDSSRAPHRATSHRDTQTSQSDGHCVRRCFVG